MFVGHYGPSFAVKAIKPSVPLWLPFIAVQLVDVAWAILILLGIEKVRIVPGITASNPLDLYYMPYTHSLVAAVLWSVGALVLCKPLRGVGTWSAAAWIGAAVFSHWVLDWVVHRPDLPLYDDAMKVGLGVAIQAYIFFGPPPASPAALALTALISYVVFAAVAEWLDRQRSHVAV